MSRRQDWSAADAKGYRSRIGPLAEVCGTRAWQKRSRKNLPAEDPITPATQWTIAGKAIPKVDARAVRHWESINTRPICGLRALPLRQSAAPAVVWLRR